MEDKKPREFWVAEDGNNFICQPTKPEKEVFETLDVIHCKEILPGDDSLRERTIAVSDVKEMLKTFSSEALRMRGEFHMLYEEINKLLERIERESKGE